jgi:hypothetical protein
MINQLFRANQNFSFIIPVRNPFDEKVSDYRVIETLLRKTIDSLTKQQGVKSNVIVVCHQVPSWSMAFGEQVTFLDVSKSSVFPPNTNPVRVDKGLKYAIGALYSKKTFDPGLIMLMDADDYVNCNLAQSLIGFNPFSFKLDGYLITKGIHVALEVNKDYSVNYIESYLVKDFDKTCGSCRVFRSNSLLEKLRYIDADIEKYFSDWPQRKNDGSVEVTEKSILWLSEKTKSSYMNEDNIVNILGRHINQNRYLKLKPISMVGAAKGCGHGNHDGPKQGNMHKDKILEEYPIEKFSALFGIKEKDYSSK